VSKCIKQPICVFLFIHTTLRTHKDWPRHMQGLNTSLTVTLYLKGCMRLTWHLHNHDMTYVMNMKEVLCMFVATVTKCHSLSYDIFNANMTLFEMSLSW